MLDFPGGGRDVAVTQPGVGHKGFPPEDIDPQVHVYYTRTCTCMCPVQYIHVCIQCTLHVPYIHFTLCMYMYNVYTCAYTCT